MGTTTRALCITGALCFAQQSYSEERTMYRGVCDASAAVALGKDHFVVADDEDKTNTLRIYKRGNPTAVGQLPLGDFLAAKKEADVEGAATIGTRIYWIASHGNNEEAKERPDRHRFFATKWQPPSTSTLEQDGNAYTKLQSDLLEADKNWGFGLAEAAKRAPKDEKGGFNIEGLASTPDDDLLIAFRNPLPNEQAIIVPLKNPEALIEGKGKAKFGEPMLLNLGKRGIRSIERVDSSYLIVAGAIDEKENFALYRWSGKATDADPTPIPNVNLKDFRPEVLFAIPGTNQIQLLSDDGAVPEGNECKKQDPSKQAFGSTIIAIPSAQTTQNRSPQNLFVFMDGTSDPYARETPPTQKL